MQCATNIHKVLTLSAAVLAFYCQTGGQNGTHEWKSDTTNIGAVSYIAMQVYEYVYHRTFRGIHQRNATLHVGHFFLLPSDCFLRLLHGTPTLSADGRTLSLEDSDFQVFSQLKARSLNVVQAVKALAAARAAAKKRAKKKAGSNDEGSEEE